VRQLQRHSTKEKEVARLVEKHWGTVRPTTPAEKTKEVERVARVLGAGKGDARAGKRTFADTCGKCHKLYNEGAAVGPDLTGYERDNAAFWLENVIDPSAAIRDEYTNFLVQTTDGRSLAGLIVEQDKQAVVLLGPDGQTVRLPRRKIDDLSASPVSLMPEDQLRNLTDQQVRDLFAYLMSKAPPK
jgi:putative heme-binding domain-containing protein